MQTLIFPLLPKHDWYSKSVSVGVIDHSLTKIIVTREALNIQRAGSEVYQLFWINEYNGVRRKSAGSYC